MPKNNLASNSRRGCGTQNALQSEQVKKSKRNPPWWLEAGTEICPACSHAYVIQTEYRCVACDGALCPLCVEISWEKEVLCVGCVDCEVEI